METCASWQVGMRGCTLEPLASNSADVVSGARRNVVRAEDLSLPREDLGLAARRHLVRFRERFKR